MISLDYVIHHRWDKAQVALEPIQKPDDHTIRVRLHVLQDTKLKSLKRKRGNDRAGFQWPNDLALDPREVVIPATDRYAYGVPLDLRLVSSVTQHIVRDGYTFDIKSTDPKILPSYDLLDLQYRICLMAALIGAGQIPEEYLSEPDADIDGQVLLSDSKQILVDQWFQRLEIEVVDPATAVTERLEEERAIRAAWGEPS
ncbi:integral membrane protein [Colletotrichum higginsianum]|nr:integral membrane protein [Colletotrichum higginsianum]